jgi:hypothetical protein
MDQKGINDKAAEDAPRSALADGGGFHSDAARRSKVCRLK